MPSIASAEDASAALPTGVECSVRADASWTKQEVFVWEKVCHGETADFMVAPQFETKDWDFEKKGLPDSYSLRPIFLEKILLDKIYASATPREGVRIRSARLTGTFDLTNANLEREFSCVKCQFDGGIDFTRLISSKVVDLRYATILGDLILSEADLQKSLNLSESTITGELMMKYANIQRSVFAENVRSGVVELRGAHVGKNIDMNGMTFKDIEMDTLRVDGSLLLVGVTIPDLGLLTGRVNLRNARIDGQLTLRNATIPSQFICYGTTIGKDVFLTDGKFRNVNCESVRIGQSLILEGATFDEEVDFTRAQIDGGISFSYENSSVKWGKSAKLMLANARADTIPSLSDSWPPKLEVTGLTYRNLLDGNSNGHRLEPIPKLAESWFQKQATYSPQTYEQLALAFQNQGQKEAATDIRYSSVERERVESDGPNYFWLTMLKYSVGYGYYPERAIAFVLVFIIFGTIVLRVSGAGKKQGLPYGIFYSFDMLIPLIKLREAHYKIDLDGWPRYYFYFHKIAGFVLASFLVAGISGLTK